MGRGWEGRMTINQKGTVMTIPPHTATLSLKQSPKMREREVERITEEVIMIEAGTGRGTGIGGQVDHLQMARTDPVTRCVMFLSSSYTTSFYSAITTPTFLYSYYYLLILLQLHFFVVGLMIRHRLINSTAQLFFSSLTPFHHFSYLPSYFLFLSSPLSLLASQISLLFITCYDVYHFILLTSPFQLLLLTPHFTYITTTLLSMWTPPAHLPLLPPLHQHQHQHPACHLTIRSSGSGPLRKRTQTLESESSEKSLLCSSLSPLFFLLFSFVTQVLCSSYCLLLIHLLHISPLSLFSSLFFTYHSFASFSFHLNFSLSSPFLNSFFLNYIPLFSFSQFLFNRLLFSSFLFHCSSLFSS